MGWELIVRGGVFLFLAAAWWRVVRLSYDDELKGTDYAYRRLVRTLSHAIIATLIVGAVVTVAPLFRGDRNPDIETGLF